VRLPRLTPFGELGDMAIDGQIHLGAKLDHCPGPRSAATTATLFGGEDVAAAIWAAVE